MLKLLGEEEGIHEDAVARMKDILSLDGSGDVLQRLTMLGHLRETLDGIDIAQEGIAELEILIQSADALGIKGKNTELDLTMVRGLGYYTGPIFETTITKPDNLGSVQGGGRYDELIGRFRGQSLPTTGISLGIERIVDLMDMLDLYPPEISGTVVQSLVTVFDDDLQTESLRIAMELREAGINTETYLDPRKSLGKQIGYADSKGIPLVLIAGPEEIEQGLVQIKRLTDGFTQSVGRAACADTVIKLLANGA